MLAARSWESDPSDGSPPTAFYTSELLRQVTMAVGDVSVNDYEVLTQYELQGPGHVTATQLSAVYLDPRQPRYFQAANKAVAVYTFQWDMRLQQSADGAGGQVTCVLTPKDVVQCI